MNARRDDLPDGIVADSLDDTLDRSNGVVGSWARALNTRAKDPTGPAFTEFSESGPDVLTKIESLLDSAVGADPSLAGTLTALGGGFLAILNDPIAVATDEYQASAVKEAQASFVRDNADALMALDESIRAAKAKMRELSELLDRTSVGSNWPEPDKLLVEKSQVGNRTLRDIEDALQQAQDPEERARLKDLRSELTEWMAERDARIEAERPDVDELREHMSELWDRVLELRPIMRDAAASAGPRTETGRSEAGGPLRVLSTTHHRPDAVAHVISLHDLLLATRVELTSAMSPRE